MRNIKGTLLDISSDATKNIIKSIFDNDIKKTFFTRLFFV